MATNNKQLVTMTVTGLKLTELAQAKVGQAVLIAIYNLRVGEMDGLAVQFRVEDEF